MRAVAGIPVDLELGHVLHPISAGVDVTFVDGSGVEIVQPAFQAGDGQVRVRFAADTAGRVEFRSASTDSSLDGVTGHLEIVDYAGDNPLFRHGRVGVAGDGRTLAHADATPFLWIGDTWWMGLGPRLDWPDGFRRLLDDRVAKGFSVVQIVAGPLPDFASTPEGIWDEQQANEGGWPWEPGWERLNPAYYDHADRKIAALVEAGIVPFIVGMWGYYGTVIGRDRALVHWRNLVARYAAYPVVFCIAGEFDYPGYDVEAGEAVRTKRRLDQVAIWSELVGDVARLDPYRNLVTLHPGNADSRSRAEPGTAMTLNMLQSSHWSYHQPPAAMKEGIAADLSVPELRMGFTGTLELTQTAVASEPAMPIINGEPCYEGILGGNWEDVQRFNFWTGMLSGLAGITYGADGIWQMSSESVAFANTVSRWGRTLWQQAMHYSGSTQFGLGGRILRQLAWWDLRPVSAERALAAGRLHAFGAADATSAIHYLPSILVEDRLRGMRDLPIDVPPDADIARYVDPRTGDEHPIQAIVRDDDGTWIPPDPPTFADWVLIVETRSTD